MAKSPATPNVVHLTQRRDLTARRVVEFELPEFLLFALQARVAEANAGLPSDAVDLSDYVESELVNLITIRDVAALEVQFPGFAAAVTHWLKEIEG